MPRKKVYLRRETLEEGIYCLTFDTPRSSANVFNRATLAELNEHIDAVAADAMARGLIIRSAKKSIFIAGADIKELSGVSSDDELRDIISQGQDLFVKISELPVTTVAAIHGACLGGGFELALACDYRIASDDRSTRIGLPETNLGILPAWGGCTRLPRLIGLPKALDIILAGKQVPAKSALKRGMVDAVAPKEHLMKAALRLVAKGKPSRKGHGLVNNALAAKLISRLTAPKLAEKTRGNYPANSKALEVVTAGIGESIAESLVLERNAIIELAKTPVCHNLIRIFFLRERAKRLRVLEGDDAADIKDIGAVAVIGAGVMGAGIAQWTSARGHKVLLRDINEEQVLKGMASIAKVYKQATKRRIFDKVSAREGMDRVSPSASEVPLKHVDLVIEAAVERMDVKKQIFQRLAELAPEDAVLATNTSALSISEIAQGIRRPERVIGMHYFNPVHRMPLVEIVVGEKTSPAVTERVVRFVQESGKLPVVVKDRPGFLVNRILMPYLVEAGLLFEAGASVEDIDTSMLDFGMPMGPLRLIDEVGVDVSLHVAEHLAHEFPDRMSVPAVLGSMKDAGYLGRKSGTGFYAYGKKGKAKVHEGLRDMVKSDKAAGISRTDLQERMVLSMINEAARSLDEGVVSSAEDADFGMIMGTGFAPFRGGPLHYADTLEIHHLVTALHHLAEEEDPRFEPCRLLEKMAREETRFYPA